jgi:hypothetical protein
MAIYKALLKYGHSNFKLEILEYCEKENVISREQHYLDIFKPQYNILKNAYSLLGYKHSAESRAKMSAHAENRSEETLAKMSLSLPPAKKIEVTDVTIKISTSYDSMGAAARALNISQSCISRNFSRGAKLLRPQKKPYKGRYVFTKID